MSLAIIIELAQRSAATAEGTWPVTVSGWIALVASVVSLLAVTLGGSIAYGKARGHGEAAEARMIEKLNGFGERVETSEQSIQRTAGKEEERIRLLTTIQLQHDGLVAAVGEAKQGASQCRDDAIQNQLVLGSEVAAAVTKMHGLELSLSQRITVVETNVKNLMPGRGDS